LQTSLSVRHWSSEAQELSERLVTFQEEERQLIAQELHDSTVHILSPPTSI
jgi:signal transduction histidine kinase